MMARARSAGSSTSAVLWLMIILVFLPIALGHVFARNSAEPAPEPEAVQEPARPPAG